MKTRQDVATLMKKVFDDCQQTRDAGQKEYAHDEQNALANFERLAGDLKISREQVLWVYARKHLDGILAHINGHKSQREDVRGRIKDVIVYLILLWAMIDDNESPTQIDALPGRMYTEKQMEEMSHKDYHRQLRANV